MPTVLWWGRFDGGYSRNRIMRRLLDQLGWTVREFHPHLSPLGDWEARLRGVKRPDLAWVPCFRQRDLAAAARWARAYGVPLVFDPLISAHDKQVYERRKLDPGSRGAQRLLEWEGGLFRRADRVLCDTQAHADYFAEVLGVSIDRLAVVYVGAEESLFRPAPQSQSSTSASRGTIPEVLFFGSFIPLQGPEIIVEAARRYQGPPVQWTLIGKGPLRQRCEEAALGLGNVAFEDWIPYEQLPARIYQASLLLGVFGTTPKADRVIPNKVFQAIACGRPTITRAASAYPAALAASPDCGLVWVEPGSAASLASRVAELAVDPAQLGRLGENAAATSRRFFSETVLLGQLAGALEALSGPSLGAAANKAPS